VSQELLEAIERGEVTAAQLRELIAGEAPELGLTLEEAIKRAREGRLPHDSHHDSVLSAAGTSQHGAA
jgi:hypothetical protein